MPIHINHVSINAHDLEESARFYLELLGAEPIPAPNFGVPVRWLTVGDAQTFGNHLVELLGDVVQLYVRDPAGNLVELDQREVTRLPADMRAQLKPIWDINPQDEAQVRGRLFV